MPDLFSDSNGVFFNKLGITNAQELATQEANFSWIKLSQLNDRGGVPGGKFDKAHFQEIHKTLFGKIYPWAGETRADRQFQGHKASYATGNKEVMVYAPYTDIDKNLKALADQLEIENYLKGLPLNKFIDRAAFYLDQYNYTHAFREGNGRTLQGAFTQLGYEAGYSLDFFSLNKKEDYNLARDLGMVRQYGPPESSQNLEELKNMFRMITSPLQTKEAEQIRNLPAAPSPELSEDLLKIEVKREFDVTGIRLMEMLPALRGMESPVDFQIRLTAVRFNQNDLFQHKETFTKVVKAVITHPLVKPGSQDYKDARRFDQAIAQIEKIAIVNDQKLGEKLKQKPSGPKLR